MGKQLAVKQVEDVEEATDRTHDVLCRLAEGLLSLECTARIHGLNSVAKHLGKAVDEMDKLMTTEGADRAA